MKFIRLQVKTILQSYPATSDCNASLCRLYYKINHGIEHETEVGKFFDKIVNKEIPSIETICRFSRELQEKHIELRGVKWNERQRKTEKVKNNILVLLSPFFIGKYANFLKSWTD